MCRISRTQRDELIAKLGATLWRKAIWRGRPLGDRKEKGLADKLRQLVKDSNARAARRIQALWAMENLHAADLALCADLLRDSNRNVRREADAPFLILPARRNWRTEASSLSMPDLLRRFVKDEDPEVRAQLIRSAQIGIKRRIPSWMSFLPFNWKWRVRHSRSQWRRRTRNGKPTKVGDAYDREFERYLVRLFIEKSPENHVIVSGLLEKADYPLEAACSPRSRSIEDQRTARREAAAAT